jgi:hypothetical protein
VTEFGGVGTIWLMNKFDDGEDIEEDGDRWEMVNCEGENRDTVSRRSMDVLIRFVTVGEEVD